MGEVHIYYLLYRYIVITIGTYIATSIYTVLYIPSVIYLFIFATESLWRTNQKTVEDQAKLGSHKENWHLHSISAAYISGFIDCFYMRHQLKVTSFVHFFLGEQGCNFPGVRQVYIMFLFSDLFNNVPLIWDAKILQPTLQLNVPAVRPHSHFV